MDIGRAQNSAVTSRNTARLAASPEARLLLLLSRPHLDAGKREAAASLTGHVRDWDGFVSMAARKHSLPFALRHLSNLGAPDAALGMARSHVIDMTMANLRVTATHRAVGNLLNDVDHCFFKGPSLAMRYYDDPGLRYARDVDVLVEANRFADVVRRALDCGYRLAVVPESQPAVATERDMRALLRYRHVVTLVSPANVPVEIHREISKISGLFDPSEMLAMAVESGAFGGKILPTATLFVYLCYHNTRHTWSRLHWIADLDAMVEHPSFDLAAIRSVASRAGLGPCLDAVLEMRRLAAAPTQWCDSDPDSHGGQLLDLCLQNLSGDLNLERKLRAAHSHAGLPFPWLVTPQTFRALSRKEFAARFRPDFRYYKDWPLPDRLQWLYYLSIPAGAAARRMGLA